MSHVCEFCTELFKTSYVLKKHQITAKYCLKIQGKYEEKKKEKKEEKKFECEACLKILTTKNCTDYNIVVYLQIRQKFIHFLTYLGALYEKHQNSFVIFNNYSFKLLFCQYFMFRETK